MVIDARIRRKEESACRTITMGDPTTDHAYISRHDPSHYAYTYSESNEKDKFKMAIPPSDTTVEDSLSRGLLNLSISDRNAVEEEIHGVRCLGVTEETPDLLQKSLREFNSELLAIKNSPSRIAGLQNQKNHISNYNNTGLYKRRSSKSNTDNSNQRQVPPIDVLKNVIDTTDLDIAKTTTTTSTTQKKRCYLNDPAVRLRFLRCENFDARAAAQRLVSFCELAQEVFGDFVADRPIRLSDFYETPGLTGKAKRYKLYEKKALSNSKVQYLPFRDRSGRRVKAAVGTANAELDLVLRIKINMILDWVASEDVETQRKGFVLVCWPFDPPESKGTGGSSYSGNSSVSGTSGSESSEDEGSAQSHWEGHLRPKYSRNDVAYHKRYYHAQPIRVAAMHWCSQDWPIYKILNSLHYFSIDSESQKRYKVFFGESVEIRYHLQNFGIPIDLIPLTHTMALKRQNHLQWMACRRYIEEQQQQQQHQQYQYHQQQYHQQQQFLQLQQNFQQNSLPQQPWDDELARKFFESSGTNGGAGGKQQPQQPILVECPRFYDVIIGKAKVCTNNPGNGFYSSLIEATHDEHDSLVHARDKVAMTWRILLHITEEKQGRFLDWNKSRNAWVVIQDKIVVRKKIANSYKEYKRSRYVNTAYSSKKTKVPSSSNSDYDSSNSDTNGDVTNTSVAAIATKRRKINGCLGNACGIEKDIASMFAGL